MDPWSYYGKAGRLLTFKNVPITCISQLQLRVLKSLGPARACGQFATRGWSETAVVAAQFTLTTQGRVRIRGKHNLTTRWLQPDRPLVRLQRQP